MYKIRKNRRIIALVMVFTLLFTFMAISASAATAEVQPRASCEACGGPGLRYDYERYFNRKYVYDDQASCPYMSAYHTHYKVPSKYTIICGTCGHKEEMFYDAVYCPHYGYFS